MWQFKNQFALTYKPISFFRTHFSDLLYLLPWILPYLFIPAILVDVGKCVCTSTTSEGHICKITASSVNACDYIRKPSLILYETFIQRFQALICIPLFDVDFSTENVV
jgi:hypothetical protein